MSGITKTTGGRFKVRVRQYGISLSRTCETRKEAELWQQVTIGNLARARSHESAHGRKFLPSELTAIARGTPIDAIEESRRHGSTVKASEMTFGEVALPYLKQWTGKDKTREFRVGWWIQQIGDQRILDIDKRMVRDVLDQYADGKAEHVSRNGKVRTTKRQRSGGTSNRMLAALSAVFQWGRDALDLPHNPCQEVKAKPESRGVERFLTRDEGAKLLQACRKSAWDRLFLLVLMALNTGARKGELLGLTWSDIDWTHKTAVLHDTKNSETRILTLSDEVMLELRKHRVIGMGNEWLIFRGQHPLHRRVFEPLFRAAAEAAGVAPLRFHDLRHTAASWLAQDGITLHEIANVLGHRNLATTQRYAHFSLESKRKTTDRVLGNLLEGNGND